MSHFELLIAGKSKGLSGRTATLGSLVVIIWVSVTAPNCYILFPVTVHVYSCIYVYSCTHVQLYIFTVVHVYSRTVVQLMISGLLLLSVVLDCSSKED